MLTKQGIDISFAQGLDTKTDPKRVAIGKFLELENTVFNKGGQLQKRNGYAQLAALPDTTYTYLTTFNENLTAIGPNIAAYNNGNADWVSKGTIQPLSLSAMPILRNNLNQTAADTAVASNGLACTVYIESDGTTSTNKYVVYDSETGQNIISPTAIPVASGAVSGGMRVFILASRFIIVFTNTITATTHLQYISINSNSPTLVTANADIASSYDAFSTLSWDGYISGNKLFLAYNTTSGGQAIKVTYLTSSLVLVTASSFSGYKATMVSLTTDDTNPANPTVYVSFYRSDTSVGFTLATDSNLNTIMNPIRIIPSGTILNITSAALSGTCKVFYEVSNAYSYNGAIASNYINSVRITPLTTTFKSIFSSGAGSITVSSATGLANGMYIVDETTSSNIAAGTTFTVSGTTLTLSINTAGNSAGSPGDTLTAATVTSAVTIIRSVGLASKAFINGSKIYFLAAYSSSYQPSYIMINGSDSVAAAPILAAKLAYQNGGGYLTLGLPGVSISGAIAQINYRFKDLIQAVNKDTNVPSGTQIAGIYSQTGINLAKFNFTTDGIIISEIGSDLQISGGFLWMYDGYLPVEQNFIVWPDSVKATVQTDPAPTGDVTNLSLTITNLSAITGIGVGMNVSGTGIPANTTITAVGTTTATMSAAATSSHSGITITFTGNLTAQIYYFQATYEWSDNQGNQFRSAPSIPVTATASAGHTSIAVDIPTLRLTMKTANPVKIVLYRWSTAQQLYYQTTSITAPTLNSTTTDSVEIIDVNSDATILGNNLIYTTGGVAENINGPASDIFALFDTRFWEVDAEDPNKLWYSKQVIEGVPVEMSDLFTLYIPPTTGTQTNTGPTRSLFPMDDKLIIGKKDAFVYINGTGPDNTGANNQYSQAIFITSTVGCSNQKSIALIPDGMVFQSDKGIWLLDRGLGTSYIGAPVEDFTMGATVNSAVVVPETNQVRFTLDTGITLMYDYYYKQWGTFTGVPAISSCIFGQMHTFINSNGITYQETANSYLDGTNPVLMHFKTGPIRLGDLQNYQRAYFFYLLGNYISPHKLYLSMSYDYEIAPSESILISPNNYSTPYGSGSSQSPYGQGNPYGGPSNIEDWRIFLKRQRCMAFAITLQEIFDSSLGETAGAGFTLSGLNVVCAFKQRFRPQSAATSAG